MRHVAWLAESKLRPGQAALFAQSFCEASQRALASYRYCMTPEQTGRNGPGDRPGVRKARRLSIQSDPDLVGVSRDAVAQHPSDEGVNEFAECTMVERERLRVQVRLSPVKRVFPDEPQGIAEKPVERRRGLNFRERINDKRVVGPDPTVVRCVLLAVPPCPPAGTTCAHLRILPGVGRSGIETIALAERVCGYRATPHDALAVLRPHCTGSLQGARRTPVGA
ncbi:hypothetical protein BOS5A_180061 [Bosea sp. EC-HK365B]|nr:conserved hypothetical protein [Bosea sp. 21B]VVT57115.1 hypothetical protein BOS5A_180061 [Bosea sp. EC-HK365B]